MHIKGFTLIELMVAISIIAVLASVGAIVYSSAQKNARITKRAEDLRAIAEALELYKLSTGTYPIIAACITTTSDCSTKNSTFQSTLAPKYMQIIPSDPSGGDYYRYEVSADGFDYKVRTSTTIPDSEMKRPNDFNTRPDLIDPARDNNGGAGTDPCKVDATIPAAWAIFTNGGCGF